MKTLIIIIFFVSILSISLWVKDSPFALDLLIEIPDMIEYSSNRKYYYEIDYVSNLKLLKQYNVLSKTRILKQTFNKFQSEIFSIILSKGLKR